MLDLEARDIGLLVVALAGWGLAAYYCRESKRIRREATDLDAETRVLHDTIYRMASNIHGKRAIDASIERDANRWKH